MKNITKFGIAELKLFIVVTIVVNLFSQHLFAQRFPVTGGELYIGIETAASTRTFQVISDLTTVKGDKSMRNIQMFGVTIGGRAFVGKVRIGNYNSSEGDKSPLKASVYEVTSEIYPLRIFKGKNQLINPYFTLSIDGTSVKSNGTYTPPVKHTSSSSSTCSCQCSSGPLANPDATTSSPTPSPSAASSPTASSPVAYTGDVTTARANAGVGVMIQLTKARNFLNLFAEAKYGIALANTESTQALLNTYSLSQVSMNFGVSLGIIRGKSNHKLKRVRFR